MLISNAGDVNLQPFNPSHATGEWSGVFKGMVFAILAFIGFEAAAPLGEEARNPRRTVPRAVVGSAIADRALLRALLVRVGVRRGLRRLRRAGHRRRPVAQPRQGVLGHRLDPDLPRDLQLDRGELERGGQRGHARLLLAGPQRARAARRSGTRTRSSRRRTWRSSGCPASRSCSRCVIGTIWDPLTGFSLIATLAVPVVIVVYMVVSVGCIAYYLHQRRSEFNPLLHLVLPVARDRAVLLPALLPVLQGAADLPDQGGELDRHRVAGRGDRRWRSIWPARGRTSCADIEHVYVDDDAGQAL